LSAVALLAKPKTVKKLSATTSTTATGAKMTIRPAISESDDDAQIHEENIQRIQGEHNCSRIEAEARYERLCEASENFH
jgi:hypothetical protein